MKSSEFFLVLLAHFASHLPLAIAQGTNATCAADFDWMSNSKGQSPCLVSSFLFTPCSPPEDDWVFPLSPGFHYNTPLNISSSATPCRCNTVLFSTIGACATCQGQEASIVPWSQYMQNCSEVFIQNFPADIPSEITVPAWAYLDVTKGDTFSPAAAEVIASQNLPESSATASTSTKATTATATRTGSASLTTGNLGTGFVPSQSSTASGSPAANNSNDPSESSSKNPSNISPIVGGVLGAIFGLAAVGLAVFLYVRHRRNRRQKLHPAAGLGSYSDYTSNDDQYQQQPEKWSAYSSDAPLTQPFIPIQRNRLYNPNDPTTFPSSDARGGSAPRIAHPPTKYDTSELPPVTHKSSAATYRGVPEL